MRDNEFVAILGPSGSGKTTLLNIIGGLDRYDSGDLIINGISTKKYKDRDWDSYRNHTIGFVFQSYNLIPHQTILANEVSKVRAFLVRRLLKLKESAVRKDIDDLPMFLCLGGSRVSESGSNGFVSEQITPSRRVTIRLA